MFWDGLREIFGQIEHLGLQTEFFWRPDTSVDFRRFPSTKHRCVQIFGRNYVFLDATMFLGYFASLTHGASGIKLFEATHAFKNCGAVTKKLGRNYVLGHFVSIELFEARHLLKTLWQSAKSRHCELLTRFQKESGRAQA